MDSLFNSQTNKQYDRKISKNEIFDFNEPPFDTNTISFTETYCGYCVGIVDIVNSTKITARLTNSQMSSYYSIFLNSMATVAEKYGAIVVKNVGDSLLFYFPGTADATHQEALTKCLDGSLKMIEIRDELNDKLAFERLPPIDYRVSCDYGQVIKAKSRSSLHEDIFGTTVNICAGINCMAIPNTVVIGGDLYNIVKGFSQYDFQELKSYSLGFKLQYPMYWIKHTRGQQV